MFERWGRFVYRHRRLVLAASGALLALSIVLTLRGGDFATGNASLRSGLEAARAQTLINNELGTGQSGATFLLIFSSSTDSARSAAFKSAVQSALLPLQGDTAVTSIETPYNLPPSRAPAFISKDGREALVQVTLRTNGNAAIADYKRLRPEIKAPGLSVTATGQVPINDAFNQTLEGDLQRAESVSLPAVLILLLLIFASVVAAALPLGVGVFTIVSGLGGTFALAHTTDVSQYALNIVTLIGLGVSIDYSLFVVNRFREELAAGADREEALARTMATAGRAITFSGITVAVGLSCLLFYSGTFLASMGAAGSIVVGAAVLYGLTFLPALLGVLGPRVNLLSIPHPLRGRRRGPGFWRTTARIVMRRPVVFLVPALALLLTIGVPFLHLRLANGSVDVLPAHLEARQGYDNFIANFPGQDQTTFTVVVDYPTGSPSTPARVADQQVLARRIAGFDGVLRVIPVGAGNHIAVINAISNQQATSDAARGILLQIRSLHAGAGGQLLVTGETAFDLDVVNFIAGHTPLAAAFVIVATYFVLFLLTRSLVLPLKAVVLNLVSIAASFGALVWIFQDGHLSAQLGFTPQSIDPSIPVILFAIVFGTSMDYEVLLVSRIQEEYLRTGDNTNAVSEGLQRSGRLITGAAAIMVAVFCAFALAQVVIIKSIGLGLAIAVALDASIVRILLVPAVMRLLGRFNWWAPGPLRRRAIAIPVPEAPAAPAVPAAFAGE
ncbi:MAG TPA: MMPL family transporter [Candidatus Dormibacteraeota bacterium]